MQKAVFYCSLSGNEPVRDWLRTFEKNDRAVIGADLRTVQLGFPLGMPLCRLLEDGIYEVRTSLPTRRETRILFSAEPEGLLLLHGFIKKTQKTPRTEIDIAARRRHEYRSKRKGAR